ncbi:hypothetical protein C8F01DRAFT_1295930 [Mycena amicta]|nr:hypothetical protein C8F01DRAFT_1295930 [Mycena amicta]
MSAPPHGSGPAPPPMDPLTPEVIQLAKDLLALKLYFAGCFALLFFDYFLTLADEVELIWKSKKTSMFYIFFMNRYCPMAFCIITLFAYSSPLWNEKNGCKPSSSSSPPRSSSWFGCFALTNRNQFICAFLAAIVVAECVIVFYAMSLPGTNNALPLPYIRLDSFRVCILYSNPDMDTAYLSTTIAFDSIVFALTIFTTLNRVNAQYHLDNADPTRAVSRARWTLRSALRVNVGPRRATILDTIRWDGTLYFCVILSGNVVWMALAMFSRPGLKFMNAQPSMYITSIMITRLTLSVRKVALEATTMRTSIQWPSAIFSRDHVAHSPATAHAPTTTITFAHPAAGHDP